MLHHMYIHVYTVHILVVLHFTALCILHCALLCELNDDDDDDDDEYQKLKIRILLLTTF